MSEDAKDVVSPLNGEVIDNSVDHLIGVEKFDEIPLLVYLKDRSVYCTLLENKAIYHLAEFPDLMYSQMVINDSIKVHSSIKGNSLLIGWTGYCEYINYTKVNGNRPMGMFISLDGLFPIPNANVNLKYDNENLINRDGNILLKFRNVKSSNLKLKIVSLNGKVLKDLKLDYNNETGMINISNELKVFAKGIYFIHVIENKRKKIFKVIK